MILLLLLIAGTAIAQAQSRFDDLQVCSLCHSQLTHSGDVIGPSELWPGSMMAHSARDPYWKAKVRFETATTPALTEVIEDTCLRCHAPMQQYDRRVAGKRLALEELDPIGKQGVGCTVCHQITPRRLGTRESFEGRFTINEAGEVYGPHADPFSHPMEMHSGYTPVEGRHILESSLCGTCHTVITPSVDANGEVVGEFIEQAPYLEWLASGYPAAKRSCQSCHMPVLRDDSGRGMPSYIAHNPHGFFFPPTSPRTPFGRHFLTGGNVQGLGMLLELFPDEARYLKANLERTRQFLKDAISLEVSGKLSAGRLDVEVLVMNNTGHKLPTGFPSRRIWLHLAVEDSAGNRVFESGAGDPRNNNIEPHHRRIDRPNQVMIYEAELGDTDDKPTVSLLRAATYLKDNRLLPIGFDLSKPGAAQLAPVGIAGDPDFQPGSDTVTYSIGVPPDRAPFRVQVEALYQSIMPSHAAAFEADRSSEEAAFVSIHLRHSTPAVMTCEELVVER